MSILPLVIAPDPRLNIASQKVEVVDDATRKLLADMLDTMYANDGIGLAAVQVGVHKRCIVVDIGVRDGTKTPIKFVNPEIIDETDDLSVYNEGCLSFPDQFSEVERPEAVTVRYLDLEGQAQTLEAEGLRLPVGAQCEVEVDAGSSITAEVVGFAGARTYLMPAGALHGLRSGARVLNAFGGAKPASTREHWYERLLWALRRGAIPAGRIIANAGALEH